MISMMWLILLAGGFFCIAGAVYNWDWFMESKRARYRIRLLSRNGARIFYFVIGIALVAVSFLGISKIIG